VRIFPASPAASRLHATFGMSIGVVAILCAARSGRADAAATADAIHSDGHCESIGSVSAGAGDARSPHPTDTVAARPPPTATAAPIDDSTNLHVLFGGTLANQETTFALEVGFEKRLTEYFSIEGVYDNEGHLENHHRDSVAVQLFAQHRLMRQRVRLRLGVGPLLYFDTTTANNSDGSTDAHGVGLLATMAAEVDLVYGVFAEARVNGSLTQNDFASGQVLLGLGYHLGPPDREPTDSGRRQNAIFLLGGQSIRNSFHSERGAAVMAGLERQDIVAFLGASAAYLRLGSDNGRQGLAVELSATQRFFERRLSLGIGLGPFLYGDTTTTGHKDIGVAGLAGVNAGWAVVPAVDVVVSVMREFGNKDYDLILAGLRCRFS
jgi:hypothetical protein